MLNRLQIVIPMAGHGTRMRPHTWSKPKQLLQVANHTMLGHILEMFHTLPREIETEYIFIIGDFGEQIQAYMQQVYPHLPVRYVVQETPKGQSHAIYTARTMLQGPMLMVFSDTWVQTDFAFLATETVDALVWVKETSNPTQVGIAKISSDGWVTKIVEKPQTNQNGLAVVGFYYFASSEDVMTAIENQIQHGISLNGEYYLADAINLLLQDGLKMCPHPVDVWLDAGTPQTLLQMNRYLLQNGRNNTENASLREETWIIPPVYIHPSADIRASMIGPYTSIGAECYVENSIIRNSIIEPASEVRNSILEQSLLGRSTKIFGQAKIINAGDQTVLKDK